MKFIYFLYALKLLAISQYPDYAWGHSKRSVSPGGSCKAGHYMNRTRNVCTPCPAGTFMTEEMAQNPNHLTCKKCYSIQQHEVIQKKCTTSEDTVVVCEAGYFKVYLGPGKSFFECDMCDWCGLGKNRNKPHKLRPCAPEANTVCCEEGNTILSNGQCGKSLETTASSTQTTEETSSLRNNFTQTPFAGRMLKKECTNNSYGEECHLKCSDFCQLNVTHMNQSKCDSVNGSCLFGCLIGYTGDNCAEKCFRKTYGQGCLLKCSQICIDTDEHNDSVCHHITGDCLNEAVFTLASLVFKFGLGVAIGLFLLLVILIVVTCKLFKRRHTSVTTESVYNATFAVNVDHHDYSLPQSLVAEFSDGRKSEHLLLDEIESQYVTIDEDFIYAEILTKKGETDDLQKNVGT